MTKTASCRKCGDSFVMRSGKQRYCGSVQDKEGCAYERSLQINANRYRQGATINTKPRKPVTPTERTCTHCKSKFLGVAGQVYCSPDCSRVANNIRASIYRKKYHCKQKTTEQTKEVKQKRERYEVYYSEPKVKKCDFGGCGNEFKAYKVSDADCPSCEHKQQQLKKEAFRYNKGDNYYDDTHLHPQDMV